MNDKNICAAVMDLLPLFLDGVLSSETEAFIKSHTENCTSCREVYNRLSEERTKEAEARSSVENFEAEMPENIHNQQSRERTRYERIAKKIKRRRLAFLCGTAALLILVFAVSVSMFQYAVVSGSCMEPTVLDGEKYVLNKWSYKIQAPKRNDIIVYEKDGVYYLTRIAGLPGEHTELQDGVLYINGNAVQTPADYPEHCIISERELGKDEYLVLNDNLTESATIGHYIKSSEIMGKVIITH
ncbi:MAG: signal peptidase I [Eubacteriales bacterium]|nr:signal peptidase I [Eubacteriales bacterium]